MKIGEIKMGKNKNGRQWKWEKMEIEGKCKLGKYKWGKMKMENGNNKKMKM